MFVERIQVAHCASVCATIALIPFQLGHFIKLVYFKPDLPLANGTQIGLANATRRNPSRACESDK